MPESSASAAPRQPAWRRARQAPEVEERGGGDPRALRRRDAGGGTAEVAPRAQPHLDEHKGVAVARD
jgi:hypothetical protein